MSEEKAVSKDVFVVFTNSENGADEEFNRWHDRHVHEILGVEGFIRAQRYALSADQRSGGRTPEWKYLAIYEIEGDVAAIHDAVEAAGAGFEQPVALKDDVAA